jgi:hypothetical protein
MEGVLLLYIANRFSATPTAEEGREEYMKKNKVKFSSYIRKFRMEQLQSHI